ncbi:hypothetical protein B484DRAFT_432534 [Ochromonadaceae sp. CCMP2298]|nr:hypothetical protein B484DRAFT_432534 [Ochromonadaceae sp. CCMP2298]
MPPEMNKSEKRLQRIRALVVFCLVATTVICGYGSYRLAYIFEDRLESAQYDSIAKQLQISIEANAYSKVLALKSVAALVSKECPTAAHWPNCSVGPLNSFLNITDPLIETINTRTIAFAHIIVPAQVAEYEAYAYDFLESNGYPDLGYTGGVKGISSVDTTTGLRFHDTEGYQEGGHKVLTPILQLGNLEVNEEKVMYNLYSEPVRVSALDHMIDCFNAGGKDCTSITDILHLVQDPEFRPAVLIYHPVTPYHDKGTLTGLTAIVQNWDTMFEGVLPDIVKGIHIELSGGAEMHTFQMINGVAVYQGSHVNHESHSSKKRSFALTAFAGPVNYSINIYPTQTFSDQFHTNYPYYVMCFAVLVVLFTSSIFLLYDYMMTRSATERELVMEIETKRLFVRYISHEIRTPLQTIAMGLQLLSSEILSSAEQQQLIPLPPEVAASWTEQMRDWRSLISQVVRNLVSNALKFSSPGGEVTVTVRWNPEGLRDAPAVPTGSSSGTISVAPSLIPGTSSRNAPPPWTGMPRAGSLVLTVRDGGAGMSAEDQKNLFREGVQFNANQLQHGGGSGLGLWIAKGVVELHNGLLFAHSDGEGLGSEFRCELPLVQMPILAHPKRTSLRVHANDDGDSVLCRLLKNNGFRVEEAVDGVDCVEQMQKQGQAQGLEAVHMILMGK